MRISKSQGTGKHTIYNLTDVECVTDEELEDTGVESAEQYISNWLGD